MVEDSLASGVASTAEILTAENVSEKEDDLFKVVGPGYKTHTPNIKKLTIR